VTTDQDVDDVEEVTAENPEGAAADEAAPEKSAGIVGRSLRWCKASWLPLAGALLLIAAAALSAGLYFYQYRPDQQTNPAAAQSAIRAASDGTVALLSYSPDSLDRDFSAAKTHLTGDFLSYYNQFTDQIVAPAAKQKGVKTSAVVVQSAVSELHSDSAVVLLFINQSTTSTDRPDPALSASSVLVSLTKVHGAWLISKFDPV
jgi:Mce-associated membrane protein